MDFHATRLKPSVEQLKQDYAAVSDHIRLAEDRHKLNASFGSLLESLIILEESGGPNPLGDFLRKGLEKPAKPARFYYGNRQELAPDEKEKIRNRFRHVRNTHEYQRVLMLDDRINHTPYEPEEFQKKLQQFRELLEAKAADAPASQPQIEALQHQLAAHEALIERLYTGAAIFRN